MSLFKKKKKEEINEASGLPELPKLPELPDFPGEEKASKEKIPQLPSFPTSSLGQKFSQDAIKDAVTGKKEGEGGFAEDMEEDLEMHLPLTKIGREEIGEEPKHFSTTKSKLSKDPIFIRVDKFEEGLNTFKKAKIKISEIEEMLKDIRHIKNQEEKELEEWENQLKEIKSQIQRVDTDVFSKIE